MFEPRVPAPTSSDADSRVGASQIRGAGGASSRGLGPIAMTLCLALATTCRPDPGYEPGLADDGEHAGLVAAGSGADVAPQESPRGVGPTTVSAATGPTTVSAATGPTRGASAPISATRPDHLVAALPADATTVVLVDLAAARLFVESGWNVDPDGDGLDELLGEWLGVGPRSLADASAVAVGLRDGDLFAVSASAGASASTVIAGEPHMALPMEMPPALADDLPSDAIVSVWVPEIGGAPADLRGSLAFLDAAGLSSLGVAITAGGELSAVLVAEDPEAVSRAFGRGQVFVSQSLGQLNSGAPAGASGWVTYLNRATQALFGRLSIEAAGGAVRIRVAAPDCGSSLRNMVALAFVFGAAQAAANDPDTPAVPFVGMTGDYGPCEPIQGPAPALPTQLAQLGPHRRDVRGAVVLFDYGAILRRGLPTFFGLLPFALSAETIEEVLGPSPLGMAGLGDPAAQGAYIFERSGAAGSAYHRALVLPLGVAALLPDEGGIIDMAPAAIPTVGMTWSTPGFDVAGRASASLSAVWSTAANTAPDDAVAAMLVGAAVVRPWADPLPPDHALGRLLRWSDAAMLVLTAEPAVEVVFTGAGDPPQADSLRGAIPDGLFALAAAADLNGPLDPARRAAWAASLDAALAVVSITTSPGVARFTLTGSSAPLVGAAITWSAPALATLIDRGPIEIPRPRLGGGASVP